MSEAQISAFFDQLWPTTTRPQGVVSLWEQPGKRSYHVPLNDPELAVGAALLNSRGHDVYFGVGLRRTDLGPHQRGTKSDIVALPGFWADIDLAAGQHAATNLPPNEAAIIEHILMPFEHEPTMVVHSGGGLHVYWLFERPLIVDDLNRREVDQMSRAWQERLAELAKQQGWHWDYTADLARVLRVAGTNNRKRSEAVPVRIISAIGSRYDYRMLRQYLAGKPSSVAELLGGTAPAPSTVSESKLAESLAAEAPAPVVDERSCDEVLSSLRDKIKRNRKPDRAETFAKIAAGEPFAGPGERDRMLQRVASWLAWYEESANPEFVAEILRPSLEAAAGDDPGGAMTFEDAVEKIARAQVDARRATRKQAEQDDRIRRALMLESSGALPVLRKEKTLGAVAPAVANDNGTPTGTVQTQSPSEGARQVANEECVPAPTFKSPSGPLDPEVFDLTVGTSGSAALAIVSSNASTPAPVTTSAGEYAMADLEQFAARQSALSGVLVTAETFKKRWVIQKGESFYVFVGGKYSRPIARGELKNSMTRDLSRLPASYFQWSVPKADGGFRRKSIDDVLDELCTVARGEIIVDMTIDESYYDPNTQTFYEASCPLRALTPRYDANIDHWLDLLGGPDAGKLKDWLATVTHLSKPSCGLFLSGVPSSGKTMLATGLARLWHQGGPTDMDDAFASFNSDVATCPLVVADEDLPHENGRPVTTKRLRKLIGSDRSMLRRKFLPNAVLKGAVRAMFLANSDEMLSTGDENLGPDALDAVANRFLHIVTTTHASDFLKALGGRQFTEDKEGWVHCDLIARHALWLRDNRHVSVGNRFMVEGHLTKMHQLLATLGTVPGLVVEWVARSLNKPRESVTKSKVVIIGGGRVLVNTPGVLDHWDAYIQNDRAAPTTTKINKALQNFSRSRDAVRVRTPHGRKRYWDLKVDMIMTWAEQHQIGDIDAMKERINGPLMEVIEE